MPLAPRLAGIASILIALLLFAAPAAAQDVEEEPEPEAGRITDENMSDVRDPGVDEQPAEPSERLDEPEEVGEHFDQPPETVPLLSIALVGVLAAIVLVVIFRRGRSGNR